MALKNSENIQVYVEESLEHLADIESDLLQIENNGAEIDEDIVNKVFRTAHSIKGGAGFLGFTNIKELAHKMENILGMIRKRKLEPNPSVVNLLLRAGDSLNVMINDIGESNSVDVIDLVEQLLALAEGNPVPETAIKAAKVEEKEAVTVAAIKTAEKLSPDEAKQTEFDQILRVTDSTESNTDQENQEASSKPHKKQAASFESTLRVNINLLDTLMTLAGELVLSRNQLLKALAEKDNSAVEYVGQRINLITSDLQESVMLTRMQPIGKIFQRFPRLVRDQARNLGKDVELTLEGEDVEVDKTILEAISDPLTHLVRNAIDHGIELPEVRNELGKTSVGKVVLRAFHEAGLVCLEIKDDGKGLDADLIAEKAVASDQISTEMLNLMSESEKLQLIFSPGFSMAEKVTENSGRGVGMDVVKTNLDQLGSQIEIVSQLGKGTTFRIKIPLTLAIISSQIFMDGGERYACPQANLLELIRIPADQVKHRVEIIGDVAVLRLRGHLLPLLKLSEILNTEKTYFDPENKALNPDRRQNIADRRSKKFPAKSESSVDSKIVQTDDTGWQQKRTVDDRRYHRLSTMKIAMVDTGFLRYGIIVDQLLDSEEIVVKPLGRHFNMLNIFSGSTIMGDGRVALILDVANIARESGLVSLETTDRYKELMHDQERALKNRRDIQDLLIFNGAENEQFAVALNLVDRIIKISSDEIDEAGGKRVLKYQNRTLSLCTIDQVATVSPLPESTSYLVLIFKIAGREIGLLSMMPVNAVEISMEDVDQTHSQPSIMGSIIIEDQITLLVNTYDLVHALYPEWFAQHPKTDQEIAISGKTILFAEDSEFFREQVSQFMEEEGFKVIKAEDGEAAWKLLKKHHAEIGLVVSDIEMPNLDGFGLADRIQRDDKYSGLPVIALTTLASAEDRARGEECGFSDYLVKLDQDTLIESIYRQFRQKSEENNED